MQPEDVNLGFLGVVVLSIVFSILTAILFKKFIVNDRTNSAIQQDIATIKTDILTINALDIAQRQAASISSTDTTVLTSNVGHDIAWNSIDARNNNAFAIAGFGNGSAYDAIVIPIAGYYHVTATIQFASSNIQSDLYAWFKNQNGVIENSQRHMDLYTDDTGRVCILVMNQIIEVSANDKFGITIKSGVANVALSTSSGTPLGSSATVTFVRVW